MLFNRTDTGAPLKHALLSYNISHGLSIHIFEKIAKTTTKIQEKEKSMIGKYRMRTDLAMENQEKFERDHVEISGVEIEKKKRKAEIQTTIVKITSEQGAKMMGKPKGTYVTIEAPLLLTASATAVSRRMRSGRRRWSSLTLRAIWCAPTERRAGK